MKIAMCFAALAISGCAAYKPVVTGASGKLYTAPDKCQALVTCLNSGETGCYVDREVLTTATGGTEVSECKEVTK